MNGVCGVAALAEGDTRPVDRVLLPGRAEPEDPSALLVWHARGMPDAVRRPMGDALVRRMHDLELTVAVHAQGLGVELVLLGDAPEDGCARLRHALDALVAGPLGEAVGAADWLREERVILVRRTDALVLRTEVPWRAVDALAEVLRGDVGRGALP